MSDDPRADQFAEARMRVEAWLATQPAELELFMPDADDDEPWEY